MMNSSRVGDTLSTRLSTLRSYHTSEQHIWDIGCDHGLLGLSFSESPLVKSIHLVDPSLPVIETLHKKLRASYISKGFVFIHHQEGQKLKIEPSSNCIFIAGMGGKEIGQIIQNLLPQLDQSSKIVISPHRKILELRSLLNSLPLYLYEERVLLEDDQYYQMMSLGTDPAFGRVSLYGEGLWKSETGEAYRNHQIKHFTPHADVASQGYVEYLKCLTR
jgi:tRNA (adenine22-N1)-methyltransferase